MSRFGFQQVQSSKITVILGEDRHRLMNRTNQTIKVFNGLQIYDESATA
jgi:hypothetical protein